MTTKTYRYQSEFAEQLRAEGRAEEAAHNVLVVLKARDIPVDDSARERIMTCNDIDLLTKWIRRAITAQSAEELFD
ncbi:hypothetical protein ABT294_00090 [Nonomuraea sp. NPDC000554]|uniref:hypothetical protein n=1 Tax=Nonomuraea sp. NPDC000554 TaxID=3154259 RepID=UPI00331EB95C